MLCWWPSVHLYLWSALINCWFLWFFAAVRSAKAKGLPSALLVGTFCWRNSLYSGKAFGSSGVCKFNRTSCTSKHFDSPYQGYFQPLLSPLREKIEEIVCLSRILQSFLLLDGTGWGCLFFLFIWYLDNIFHGVKAEVSSIGSGRKVSFCLVPRVTCDATIITWSIEM